MKFTSISESVSPFPESWYFVCTSTKLTVGRESPFGFVIFNKNFIAFRTTSNRVVVMDGHCCHQGSKLETGSVEADCVKCVFHGWRFDEHGICLGSDQMQAPPVWAKMRTYPTTEKFGQVFFYYGENPRCEISDFPDLTEAELYPSPPFEIPIKSPWYVIPCNAFDVQHFHSSHDRLMVAPVRISKDAALEMSINVQLKNVGTSLIDRIAALFAGRTINFTVRNVNGNLIYVTSKLRRTTTYAFVNVIPVSPHETRVVDVVMLRKGYSFVQYSGLQWIAALLRRFFIIKFLAAEVPQITGVDISLDRLTDLDHDLRGFINHLLSIHQRNSPDNMISSTKNCI